jgi:rhodanese-related sulfurtransferase
MTGKNIAVFGVYASDMDAERGAADLISADFPSPDISVLLADLRSKRELAGARNAGSIAVGSLSGALAILSGGGARLIPGMGQIVAAGPITARLERLDSAVTESLSAALLGWGIPEHEAKSYEARIREGGILLAVRCESPARAKRAAQVLNSSGADHVAALQERRAEKAEWALI